MDRHFENLLVILAQRDVPLDEATCHGLLTGYATTPLHDERKLSRQLGSGQPVSQEALDAAYYAIAGIQRALASGNFEPLLGSATVLTGAGRWLEGYFDAVKAHDDHWDELGATHPDAALDLVMLHALLDSSLAREMPELQLPGPQDLEKEPQLLAELVMDIYRHFHGLADEDESLIAADLPEFSSAVLAGMDEEELMSLLVIGGDTVPFNLIQECAARGEAMIPFLRAHLENPATRGDHADESCWLANLHALMILGLMPGRTAAEALLEGFRQITFDETEVLSNRLSGAWPALCRNKREYTTATMAAIADDASLTWQARSEALECVLAAAADEGTEALEAAIDRVAEICADEAEPPMVRVLLGHMLLDFPRERHRALLESLVDLQRPGSLALNAYDLDEIDHAFNGRDQPEWERFADPWSYYSSEAIRGRHCRDDGVDDEDEAEVEWYAPDIPDDDLLPGGRRGTYVRETPKVGRNEPCPCGSGRKYKQCCLNG